MPRPTYEAAIVLPPSIHPAVTGAAREFGHLTDELAREWRKLDDLHRAKETAEQTDHEALAVAIRAGRPDPGAKAVEQADKAIATSERRIAALQLALAESRRELLAAVEANRQDWGQRIEARIEDARDEYMGAVENLVAAHQAMNEALADARWLRSFPGRPEWACAPMTGTVGGLLRANGDPESWPMVVAALRELGQPTDRSFGAALQRLAPAVEPAALVDAGASSA